MQWIGGEVVLDRGYNSRNIICKVGKGMNVLRIECQLVFLEESEDKMSKRLDYVKFYRF